MSYFDTYDIEIKLSEEDLRKYIQFRLSELNEREKKVLSEAVTAAYFEYEPDLVEHIWNILEFIIGNAVTYDDKEDGVMEIWYDELKGKYYG